MEVERIYQAYRFAGKIDRKEFFAGLATLFVVLLSVKEIYTRYIVTSDFPWIRILKDLSIIDFVFFLCLVPLAMARLRHIGWSQYYALSFIVFWIPIYENQMIMILAYSQNPFGGSPLLTHLSDILITAFLLILCLKKGDSNQAMESDA